MADACADYCLFTVQTPQGQEAIRLIDTLCNKGQPEHALEALSAGAALMNLACRLMIVRQQNRQSSDGDWQIMRRMTGYIQQNYMRRITLEEISAAGTVCRSRCCMLFRRLMNVTPNEYLTRYRLEKACLLLGARVSVTEAAFASGFRGTSYFSETFKRIYGLTPSEYRNEIIKMK